MRIHEIEIEQLRAAPADTGAMHSCDQDFGIALEDLAERAPSRNLFFDRWTAGCWRLKRFTCAVVLAFAASDAAYGCQRVGWAVGGSFMGLLHDHTDLRLFACPEQCIAEVEVLLDGEGVGDFGLIVAEEDGLGGEAVDGDG